MIWPWTELKRLRVENARLNYEVKYLRHSYDIWRANWLERTRDLYAAHKGIRRLKNKLLRMAGKDLLK
jgi:hypothetical protein